jgi:hypothetical protein
MLILKKRLVVVHAKWEAEAGGSWTEAALGQKILMLSEN